MTWCSRGSSVGRASAVAAAAVLTIALAGCGAVTEGTAVRGTGAVQLTQPTSDSAASTAASRPSSTAVRPTASSRPSATTAAGAIPDDQVFDLAKDVLDAHRELTTVTKTVLSRDPYSVDSYTAVEVDVGGRVHQQVTFEPTTSAIFDIEEIRCLGAENFVTPIPFDLDVVGDDAQPWVRTVAEPAQDAPGSEQLTSYFCDGGYPTGLSYDVEFLLSAGNIVDLGDIDHNGEQVRQLTVDVPLADAYSIPGLGWVGDAEVPDDDVQQIQVALLLGADNLVRRLTSKVQVDGRELGVEIDFSAYNQDVTIDPPDPAQVAPR